jgi:hypothetical protein
VEAARAVERRIAEQYGLITRAQALHAGLTRRQVDYRVETGAWVPLGGGVYRVRDRASHPLRYVLEAVLVTRGNASHRTGGGILGLLDAMPARPELTIESHRTTDRPYRVYRSTLLPGDTTRVGPIPTTTATRTLLDLGDRVPCDVLEEALHRALHRRLTSVPTLFERIEAAGRGHRFLEGDGFGVHTTRYQFERDRSRQNVLVVLGWLPLRFTWRQVVRAPDDVCEQVGTMLDQRRAA